MGKAPATKDKTKTKAKAKVFNKPVIKWTGGKFSELPQLQPYLPTKVSTFIDPFVGGGAMLYNIKAERYCINDIDKDLMMFYIMTWKVPLWKQFQAIIKTVDEARQVIRDATFRKEIPTDKEFVQVGMAALHKLSPSLFCPIANGSLPKEYEKRIARIASHHSPMENPQEYIRTGLFSVLYASIRSAMNAEILANRYTVKRLAAWFFIRDMAYGCMQRFALKGERKGSFNVPYGGASYNGRSMSTKVDRFANYRSGMTTKTFDVQCQDFMGCLHHAREQYGDIKENFIFLDPPYDTAFSSYSSSDRFMPERYEELLEFLLNTNMRFMLVLKVTPLMRKLFYNRKGWYYRHIDKKYRVNIRNRNNREARHVIITNYRKPASFDNEVSQEAAD